MQDTVSLAEHIDVIVVAAKVSKSDVGLCFGTACNEYIDEALAIGRKCATRFIAKIKAEMPAVLGRRPSCTDYHIPAGELADVQAAVSLAKGVDATHAGHIFHTLVPLVILIWVVNSRIPAESFPNASANWMLTTVSASLVSWSFLGVRVS